MEKRAKMREAIGVPCPKCGTKNLADDGFGWGWSGGANSVSTHYMCRHCNSQYAETTEFREEWDRETWGCTRVPVRTYTHIEVER